MRLGGHHGIAAGHQQRRVGDVTECGVRVKPAERRHLLAGEKSHGYLLNPSE
ncbi:hypothetical protein BN128_853 [Cronobacter sakazakii 696]|nr:hypothetical protein BN128_853 [Cronobacter sakazakii 696]